MRAIERRFAARVTRSPWFAAVQFTLVVFWSVRLAVDVVEGSLWLFFDAPLLTVAVRNLLPKAATS